jgi:hypothetical protein
MAVEFDTETFGPERVTGKEFGNSLPATLERRAAAGWEAKIYYSTTLGTRGLVHSALVVFTRGQQKEDPASVRGHIAAS